MVPPSPSARKVPIPESRPLAPIDSRQVSDRWAAPAAIRDQASWTVWHLAAGMAFALSRVPMIRQGAEERLGQWAVLVAVIPRHLPTRVWPDHLECIDAPVDLVDCHEPGDVGDSDKGHVSAIGQRKMAP
jgi:hypothetical protein